MYQDLFCPHDGIYLLNHSVGRPLKSARQQITDQFFGPWEHGAADVWPHWLESIDQFRQALAELFNSKKEQFCPQVNLSSALTKVIYSFPFIPEKPVILLSERDFPSMGFSLKKAETSGYRLKFIPDTKDHLDLDVWNHYLSDNVRFVLITHVQSNTSHLVPAGEIAEMARSKDILSILDIAQSAGVVPIDLQTWQPDVVLGSCVKWLCGGPGAAYLWMKEALLAQANPIDVGWFSHQNPFEFDIHNFTYHDDALRFSGGTPSVMPYILAAHSIKTLHEIGIEKIRQHNIELTERVIKSAGSEKILTPANPAHRGGTLVINFTNRQNEVIAALERGKIRYDQRPTGLRFSPHIYNTAEEIEKLKDCFFV